MRIHELRLQNFRRFEDLTVKFPERFSVLVGDNGMGKTSVLDAVAVCLSSYLQEIKVNGVRKIDHRDVRNWTDQYKAKQLSPICEVVSIGNWGSLGHNFTFHAQLQPAVDDEGEQIYQSGVDSVAADDISMRLAEEGNILPMVAYFGTRRLYDADPKLEYASKATRLGAGYGGCLSINSSSKLFLSWFKTFEDEARKFNDRFVLMQLDLFKQAITEVIPNWTNIAFSFLENDIVGSFSDENGTVSQRLFGEFSDGYRNVIGMIADMTYRCLRLNPHLGENAVKETPGIVLIDELDLHLHPNWQRNIVADLKRAFPKVQFIATTHSPFIVQSLREEELVVLDDGQRGGDPRKRSIEEIAALEMGVEDVGRSESFMEMQKVAEQYLSLISNGHGEYDDAQLATLKAKLDSYEERYAAEPVFVAMLKLKRLGKGL